MSVTIRQEVTIDAAHGRAPIKMEEQNAGVEHRGLEMNNNDDIDDVFPLPPDDIDEENEDYRRWMVDAMKWYARNPNPALEAYCESKPDWDWRPSITEEKRSGGPENVEDTTRSRQKSS